MIDRQSPEEKALNLYNIFISYFSIQYTLWRENQSSLFMAIKYKYDTKQERYG